MARRDAVDACMLKGRNRVWSDASAAGGDEPSDELGAVGAPSPDLPLHRTASRAGRTSTAAAAQDLPEKRSRRLAVVIVRCLPTRSSGEKQRRRGVVAVVDCDVKRRPPTLAVSCAQQRCTGGHRGAGRWRENQCGGGERSACGVTMQRCCSVAHVAEVRGGCGFDTVASGALRQRPSRCAVARQPEDCSALSRSTLARVRRIFLISFLLST